MKLGTNGKSTNKAFSGLLLAAAFLFSIACGGGGGGGGSARTITGTIDASVLTEANAKSGEYEIWAKLNDGYLKKGTITSASGEDPVYTITGLLDGTTYEIALIRVAGFSKVGVLSSVVTANASSESLSKTRSKHRAGRQMNVVTTYIARKYVTATKDSSTTTTTTTITILQSITFATLGTSNLNDVAMQAGKLTSVAGTAIVFVDPIARAAVTQLTISVASTITMTTTSLAANAVALASFVDAMAQATSITAIVAQVTGSLGGFVSAAISSTTASAFGAAVAAVDTYTAAALGGTTNTFSATTFTSMTTTTLGVAALAVESAVAAVTGGTLGTAFVSTLAASTGITATSLQTQSTTLLTTSFTAVLSTTQLASAETSAGGIVNATTFELAHATYGAKDTSGNFTISTLSPVFKIVLAGALSSGQKFSDFVTVTLTNTSSKVSISNTDLSTDTLVRTVTSDNKTFYLMIVKSASANIAAKELSPGETFSYSIKPQSGKTLKLDGTEKSEVSGTITIKDITFTYPVISTTTDSLVDLGVSTFSGLSSKTPTFVINSKSAMDDFSSSSNSFGILPKITTSVKAGTTTIAALKTGNNFTTTSATSLGALVTVKTSAGLAAGTSYTLDITATTLTVGGTAITVAKLPGTQTMTIQSSAL